MLLIISSFTWSVLVFVSIGVTVYFLRPRKKSEVTRKGKVIVLKGEDLDECEQRFYSDYEKENWN